MRQARTYTPKKSLETEKSGWLTIDKIASGQTLVGRLFEREN